MAGVVLAARESGMNNDKADTVVHSWEANGHKWRELRVWARGGFSYFVQREVQPGVWA